MEKCLQKWQRSPLPIIQAPLQCDFLSLPLRGYVYFSISGSTLDLWLSLTNIKWWEWHCTFSKSFKRPCVLETLELPWKHTHLACWVIRNTDPFTFIVPANDLSPAFTRREAISGPSSPANPTNSWCQMHEQAQLDQQSLVQVSRTLMSHRHFRNNKWTLLKATKFSVGLFYSKGWLIHEQNRYMFSKSLWSNGL